MKSWVKWISMALIFVGAIALISFDVYGDDIRVRFNGEYVDIYPAPFIEDGRVMVPVRAVSEMLGADVRWDGEMEQVHIELDGIHILLTIDSNMAVVNGEDVELDAPAMLIGGSTFVPLRFVAEGLGVFVEFEEGVDNIAVEIIDISGYWYYVISKQIINGVSHFFDDGGDFYRLILHEDGRAIISFVYPMAGTYVSIDSQTFNFITQFQFIEEKGWRYLGCEFNELIPFVYNYDTGFLQFEQHLFLRFNTPNIKVQVANDEILLQLDTYHDFSDHDEHGYRKIIITSDVVLWNFELRESFAVDHSPMGRVIGGVDYISPDLPIVLKFGVEHYISGRTISFANEKGRVFYIGILYDEIEGVYSINERFWESQFLLWEYLR